MTTRVYLSGPITGLSEEEYTRRFARAEQHYRTAGYEVVNPVTIGQELQKTNPHPTYEDYMEVDLAGLRACTHIAMLPGWSQSPGAKREKQEAERLGLEIMQYREIGGKK
jgi:type II secretory pathway pseudopilin PulG